MARADLGIAMAGAGTDIAIEAADVVLMTDDLSRLPWLLRHSRRVLSIIRQNVAAALLFKALVFVLALFGVATLWLAIAADMGVSLAVVLNALRLLRG
jgi:Cd2+/Zn2+-exporting ATPase